MNQILSLGPGIRLRCIPDSRFKQGCLSLQLVRPMCREEASRNALLPAVLLRGTKAYPDLRAITLRLDDLYGASVGTLVRRVGDYQTTGFYCGFMEDRFALEGDAILEPMLEFVGQLLLEPVLEDGCFREDFVESEKRNLIASIESQLNDKRAYAMEQMIRTMCKGDSFGIPRLGEISDAQAVTPRDLYDHYQKILRESRVELLYVGSAPQEQVAALLKGLFDKIDRNYVNLPEQSLLRTGPESDTVRQMDVNQGKLCMGLVSDITIRDEAFVPMQLLNHIFGGGMTSKLFMQIRERQSLCYAIGSGFHGSKGLMTVSAGIDSGMKEAVQQGVMAQLEACCRGEITPEEVTAAKESLRSSLLATQDSPGALEGYYATAALSGLPLTPDAYIQAVEETTLEQIVAAAKTLKLHTVFFLKGVES